MKIFRILVLFLVGLAAMLKAEDSCRFPVLNEESWQKSASALVDIVKIKPDVAISTVGSEIEFDFFRILNQAYNIGNCPLGICGELREAADCNNGKCVGEGFDKSGKRYEAHCVNGEYNGKQILYDDNKKVIMELNYVNGILDGKQKLPNILHNKEYGEDKIIINDVVIKNGKLNGKILIGGNISPLDYLTKFYELHSFLGFDGEVKNGKIVGTAGFGGYASYGDGFEGPDYKQVQFDNNGKLKSLIYKGTDGFGKNIEYLFVYNNDKVTSIKYVKGIKEDSLFFTFNITNDEINKKLKEIPNVHYITAQYNEQGQKQGKWIKQENNNIIESNYANDKLNGVKKEWKNGKLIKEETYANDELNGDVKEYDENGELIKHEIYKNNKRTKILK